MPNRFFSYLVSPFAPQKAILGIGSEGVSPSGIFNTAPRLIGHSRQKVQARSAMPFAVELLPARPVFQVDGTWNVPPTLIFVGCVLLTDRSNPFFNESEIDANENSRNRESLFGARCSV